MVKDHEDNFPHSISCRLINPSKTDTGFNKINIRLVSSIKLNQRKK